MNLLIVEDDTFKYSKIEQVVEKSIKTTSLRRFDNVHDTIRYIETNIPDKIILDMSLPSHKAKVREGSPLPMPSGGIEIILELNSMDYFEIPIFILTQYHEIEIENEFFSIKDSETEIMKIYEMNNLKVVYYESESFSWESELNTFLKA